MLFRLKHYAYKTEKTYITGQSAIFFYDKRHPAEMGIAEIEAFLTHLAKDELGFASTQNQALNARLFIYREGLQMDLPVPIPTLRAKRS